MNTSLQKPLRILLLFPFLFSVLFIIASTVYPQTDTFTTEHGLILLTMTLIGLLLVLSVISIFKRKKNGLFLVGILVSSLSPLALLYPWVLVPDNLGMGLGGYQFFLVWLTKYPNFGPVNRDVLIGIFCVIISSYLPAIVAYIFSTAFRLSRLILLVILLIETIAYVPVFIRLDSSLLLVGISGNIWLRNLNSLDLTAFTGSLLRLLSFFFTIFTTISYLSKRSNEKTNRLF